MYFTNAKGSSFKSLTFNELNEVVLGLSRKETAIENKKAKLHKTVKIFIVVCYRGKEAECSIYKVILTVK